MLQLPIPSKGATRFTRAQIAEITRDKTVKVVRPRTRPDYIVSQIGNF